MVLAGCYDAGGPESCTTVPSSGDKMLFHQTSSLKKKNPQHCFNSRRDLDELNKLSE